MPGDRSGPGPTVSLDHITVDHRHSLTHGLESTTARNYRPMSREISLARPPETWSRRTLSGEDPGEHP